MGYPLASSAKTTSAVVVFPISTIKNVTYLAGPNTISWGSWRLKPSRSITTPSTVIYPLNTKTPRVTGQLWPRGDH